MALRASDRCVFMNHEDLEFPVEGMAAGLGPVATALAGTRETVRDAGDRELLERLRRAVRADAQALTWRRIAERNLEVYAEAGAR